ncbi:hypothetical protein Dimus_004854 [Dionaea muscipula]
MEEKGGDGGGAGNDWALWWWAVASTAQLALAIRAYRKGYAGNSHLMPIKAFGVASLFVGAATAATVGTLKSFGIHQVDDLKEVGANIRTGLGIPPRNTR